jgi:hypothetical protein
MARIDRIFARASGAPRKVNKRQKLHRVFGLPRGTPFRAAKSKEQDIRMPHHMPGSPWWRERFAELVDRRSGDVEVRKAA